MEVVLETEWAIAFIVIMTVGWMLVIQLGIKCTEQSETIRDLRQRLDMNIGELRGIAEDRARYIALYQCRNSKGTE